MNKYKVSAIYSSIIEADNEEQAKEVFIENFMDKLEDTSYIVDFKIKIIEIEIH